MRYWDEFQDLLAQTFGLDAEAYTSLITVEDEMSLVTKDGGLMSVLALEGHLRVVGAEELALLTHQLLSLLGAITNENAGHFLDVVFASDPARTEAEIASLLEAGRRTAERLDLDLHELFAERQRHLPTYTSAETCYLVLWTAPEGLPRSVRRQAGREIRRALKGLPALEALDRHNQNPWAGNPYLVDAHRSTVKTLLNELRAFGFEVDLLPAAAACRAIRREADPEWTPPHWTPLLPGGALPAPRERPGGQTDAAGCWFPAFGQQLIPRGMEIVDYRTVRVGDRLYQPFFIDVPQLTEVQRFEKLLARVRQERLPWRVLFRLCGGAQAWLHARSRWMGLLGFAGHQNKLIDAAVRALLNYINEGNLGVRVQVAATTWVRSSDPRPNGQTDLELLRARTAYLASHFQAWGACTARESTGHPVRAWVSTMPGLSRLNVATRYAAPLADVLKTLPLFRPASAWKRGTPFRTRDGRLFPYQPGSELQGTWIELYFARPGSGKSVLLNLNNLALIGGPGFRQLPFVRIVDIGPSSEGLISLVREALPPNRRFEAQFHALQNDAAQATNPLDTPLGVRRPPPQKRAFLVSFLSVLATSPGEPAPPVGLSDMVGQVIDLAYWHYGDGRAPKPYAPAQDESIDAALRRLQIALPERPTWWEVVDALYAAGDIPAAIRAQRYAVPLLSDLVVIAQTAQVQDIYGNTMQLEDTRESPIQVFNRVISAVTREWPLLAYPTRWDLGNARVVSLDVAALCGDMSPVGRRQTAIAYLLALHVLSHDLFMSGEAAAIAPDRYRAYHERRADTVLADPMRFCLDEMHRAAGIPEVMIQIVRRAREGRKANVHVALASQILEDFPPELAELATSVFIMEYTSDETAEALRAKFSLSRSALDELRVHGTGPTAAGAPFLGVFRTKRGVIAHLLYATAGPVELWALSTTAEDRIVRQRLTERFGADLARKVLAKAYPGGTIRAELQRRLDGSADPGVNRDTVLAALVDEMTRATETSQLRTAAPRAA